MHKLRTHHIVGGIFVILLLLVFVVACNTDDDDGDRYYHVPGSSHSKVHKPKVQKHKTYKVPKSYKRK